MDEETSKLTKPSASSFNLILFTDRALGRKIIPEALRAAGAVVHIHDDYFEQGALDEEWLPVVGEKGWVVLTKDERIRYRAIERDALTNAGVRAFVVVAKNLSAAETAEVMVNALPKIAKFVEENTPPFIAKIYRTGEIKKLELS